MSQKTKVILGIAGFAALLAAALLGYNALSKRMPQEAEPPPQESSRAGLRQAPDFTVTDEQGSTYRLSDFRGKPVVLNFWASWCPPCREEMPEFDKVHEELGDEVQFMMVNLTGSRGETVATGSYYIYMEGFGLPVYYDTLYEAGAAYNISSIPVTFFIDAQGNLVSDARGAVSEAKLRKALLALGVEGD